MDRSVAAGELPIPHRDPFLFLTEAAGVEADEGLFLYELPRDPEALVLRLRPELVMVEAMAQAAAAWHGLRMRREQGEGAEPETGVLAAVDKAKFSGRPRPGDRLTIKVRRRKAFGAMVLLDGEVWVHHRMLAQAELSVRRGRPEEAA